MAYADFIINVNNIPKRFKGDYEAYKAYMRDLGSRPHKRGGKSKIVRQIEIKAQEEGVSADVIVKRLLK